MLSDRDLMRVQEVAGGMTRPVTIEVSGSHEQSPFADNLANVARQIAGVSGDKILWEEAEQSLLPGKPSLSIVSGFGRNIHYLAVPEGHQLEPFLTALSRLAQDPGVLMPASGTSAHVLVFVAAMCPHCPQMVRSVLSLAVEDALMTVQVVDAVQFPDLAERYKVRSTPTTIVNDTLTLVGAVSREDLATHVSVLRESGATTAVIESMIESGRAENAAELVCKEHKARAVLPIYVSPEFSRRMGAMVVLEDALEIDPRCLDPIVDDLIAVLSHEDVGLRGDTAGLLGKIGSARAIPALKTAIEDPDPDVREAAEEALALIEESRP
ncbi:MAG: thioredoxin family protein [Thermodesulfobacteriota bacterium]